MVKEGMAQAPELVFPKLEEKTSLLSAAGLFTLIGSVLVIGLAILTAIVAATRRSEVQLLTRKNQELETQLRSGELSKLKFQLEGASKSAADLKQVLDSRTDWQGLLQQISRSLVKPVSLTALSFDGSLTLRLDGISPDFGSIAKQVASLRQLKAVSSVEVASLSRGTNQVSFSLNLKLKLDELAYKKATSPSQGAAQ